MIYYVEDFLRNEQIQIAERLFEQERYTFTNENVREFWSYFYFKSFTFEGVVKSINIISGFIKPHNRNSIAYGLLMPYSAQKFLETGQLSDSVGTILFTCCPDNDTSDIIIEHNK